MNSMSFFSKLKIIYILLFSLFLSSCSADENMTQESEIRNSIDKIIEDTKKLEKGMKFNLEGLQVVMWDRLYIFSPYTPSNDIANKLGSVNATVKKVNIEARDDINLLVFMLQSKVIGVVPYPREKVDFSRIASGDSILKEKSFFEIIESVDEEGWFYVELAK